MQIISHPLDVFVTNNTERQILDIFVDELVKVSPRKRKSATEFAVNQLRKQDSGKFANVLAQALTNLDNLDKSN